MTGLLPLLQSWPVEPNENPLNSWDQPNGRSEGEAEGEWSRTRVQSPWQLSKAAQGLHHDCPFYTPRLLASCLPPEAQPSSLRGWPGSDWAGLGCRISLARAPPTLGPLPQWSRFLTLFLGLISLPCCIRSPDTPHLEVLLYLPALEPCQRFPEMLVDPASWGRREGSGLRE